jgi:hypothetical protein
MSEVAAGVPLTAPCPPAGSRCAWACRSTPGDTMTMTGEVTTVEPDEW